MTHLVAITVGIPILSSIAAAQGVELTGIHLALSVNAAVTLISVILIWFGLRPRGDASPAVEAVPVSKDAVDAPTASVD